MSTDGPTTPPHYATAAPQYGQPPQGQPQYATPPQGQPQYAQPPQGQPQYSQPPQYGQPMPQQYGTQQQQQQAVGYPGQQPQYAQTSQYAQPVQYGQPQQVFVQSPGQPQVVYQQPTIVTLQPQAAIVVNAAVPFTPFQTGICDCCQDPAIFILACLVPCWVAGLNEELKTGPNPGCGCTFFTGLCIFGVSAFLSVPCVFNWWLGTRRSDTRYRYRIAGDACEDFCCHCCCMSCALTQENIEIKKRKLQLAQQAPATQVMLA